MVWERAPLTPTEEGPMFVHYAVIPESPNQLPPTPAPSPALDRPATGLERYLSPIGPPSSPLEFFGSEANTNAANRDMSTGRSASRSPPRSLLTRLLQASQEEGD